MIVMSGELGGLGDDLYRSEEGELAKGKSEHPESWLPPHHDHAA